jgi:hypothetical protein
MKTKEFLRSHRDGRSAGALMKPQKTDVHLYHRYLGAASLRKRWMMMMVMMMMMIMMQGLNRN